MQPWMLMVSLLFLFVSDGISQTNQYGCENPYPVSLARALLETPRALPPGVHVELGVTEKELYRSGDAFAIGLVKYYDEEGLKDPEHVKEFLPLIRRAFSHPNLITFDLDKKPTATQLLLGYLQTRIRDPKLRREITETAKFVTEKTAEHK